MTEHGGVIRWEKPRAWVQAILGVRAYPVYLPWLAETTEHARRGLLLLPSVFAWPRVGVILVPPWQPSRFTRPEGRRRAVAGAPLGARAQPPWP